MDIVGLDIAAYGPQGAGVNKSRAGVNKSRVWGAILDASGCLAGLVLGSLGRLVGSLLQGLLPEMRLRRPRDGACE